jgi:hypothetical protein
MNEFDWTNDINSLPIDTMRASNKSMKYEPILTDGIFTEVRSLVTKIWNTFDNEFGYVDEKMAVVNSLPQEWTSVIQMIRMFHVLIQRRIFEALSDEANESIKLEMYDRGWCAQDF